MLAGDASFDAPDDAPQDASFDATLDATLDAGSDVTPDATADRTPDAIDEAPAEDAPAEGGGGGRGQRNGTCEPDAGGCYYCNYETPFIWICWPCGREDSRCCLAGDPCVAGLSCSSGTCREPDAGEADATSPDTGADAPPADASDGAVPDVLDAGAADGPNDECIVTGSCTSGDQCCSGACPSTPFIPGHCLP